MRSHLPKIKEELEAIINKIEQAREKKNLRIKKFRSGSLKMLVAFLVLGILFNEKFDKEKTIEAIILIVAAYLIVFIYSMIQLSSFYKKTKETIIKKILEDLFENISYLPYSYFSSKEFVASNLFDSKSIFRNKKVESVSIKDTLIGIRGETNFELNEIVAYKGSGDNAVNIFKGLLIQCELKDELGVVNVYSNDSPNKIKKPQNYNLKKHLTNDLVFDANFDLLIQETKSSLPFDKQNLINFIREINDVFSTNLYVSFLNNNIYIATSVYNDLFELNVNEKVDIAQVTNLYDQIIKVLMIVDAVDELNARIKSEK